MLDREEPAGATHAGLDLVDDQQRAALGATLYEDLPARAARLGADLLARLRELPPQRVREVRGLGLMIGIELREKAAPYLRALLEAGIIALPAGPSVIRLLPPLVIREDELDRVVDALHGVLAGERIAERAA